MPRNRSPAVRTTLYRLLDLGELVDAVRPKYRASPQFEVTETDIAGHSAVLVVGAVASVKTSWAPRVEELTGLPVDVGNQSSAGVLVVRDEAETAWALSYGMGFQLLEQRHVDPAFGVRCAVRAAHPDLVRSLTRTILDHRSRTDRSSIPGGEPLRGFGIGDFGEIVSRLVGPATIAGLTQGDSSVTIRAADALSVPLGRTASDLVSDLDAVHAVLAAEPRTELEFLEQLKPVKNPDRVASLENQLRQALLAQDHGRLAISWPHERIDENGTATSYRLHGAGRGNVGPFDDLPALDDLVAALTTHTPSDPLAAASSLRIQLFRDADGDEAMSPAIPALKWLAFEIDLESQRYCLHDGRWYLMDQDYADRLRKRIEEIFARDSGLELPVWTADQTEEKDYNKAAADATGATLLDRRLIHTELHRHGIEPCDLIAADGSLIHVKKLTRSSEASHLIAQALVSADALLYDEEARTLLRERITEAGGDPNWLPDRPARVVLAMARRRPVTAKDLFTFTQVTLARLDAALSSAGLQVFVVPVQRE